MMTGTTEGLLYFIASALQQFVEKEERHSKLSPNLKRTWVEKGFAIKDMVGREVSECLQEILAWKELNTWVVAQCCRCKGMLYATSHLACMYVQMDSTLSCMPGMVGAGSANGLMDRARGMERSWRSS